MYKYSEPRTNQSGLPWGSNQKMQDSDDDYPQMFIEDETGEESFEQESFSGKRSKRTKRYDQAISGYVNNKQSHKNRRREREREYEEATLTPLDLFRKRMTLKSDRSERSERFIEEPEKKEPTVKHKARVPRRKQMKQVNSQESIGSSRYGRDNGTHGTHGPSTKKGKYDKEMYSEDFHIDTENDEGYTPSVKSGRSSRKVKSKKPTSSKRKSSGYGKTSKVSARKGSSSRYGKKKKTVSRYQEDENSQEESDEEEKYSFQDIKMDDDQFFQKYGGRKNNNKNKKKSGRSDHYDSRRKKTKSNINFDDQPIRTTSNGNEYNFEDLLDQEEIPKPKYEKKVRKKVTKRKTGTRRVGSSKSKLKNKFGRTTKKTKVTRSSSFNGYEKSDEEDEEDEEMNYQAPPQQQQPTEEVAIGPKKNIFDNLDAILGDEAFVQEELFPCPKCGKKFNERGMKVHLRKCGKEKKRKKFNMTKMRVGNEGAKLFKKAMIKEKREKKKNKGKIKGIPKWKKQHMQFQQIIHVTDDPSQQNAQMMEEIDDRVPCPHCGRKFSENVAKRHIPNCANIINKPKTVKRKTYDPKAARMKKKFGRTKRRY